MGQIGPRVQGRWAKESGEGTDERVWQGGHCWSQAPNGSLGDGAYGPLINISVHVIPMKIGGGGA